MKLLKRVTAFLAAVSMLPVFSVKASENSTDVAIGKSITNSNGSYILDLERAYPVHSMEISGVSTAAAKVTLSNAPEFPQNGIVNAKNVALNKPVKSKLYGQGGYADYAVKYVVDGDMGTQFISTPNMSAVEWITIDLEHPAYIDTVNLTFSAKRTYTVLVTNTPHGQTEEFTDGVELTEGSDKTFTLPDMYADTAFRYVRLRFSGDAPSDYYADTNMYVNEFSVIGSFEKPDRTTVTLIKDDSSFLPNDAVRGEFFRYAKIDGVSSKPNVKVDVKAEYANCVNIAPDAKISLPEGAVIYGGLTVDRVVDDNYFTFTAFNHHSPYIQFDLHDKNAISHVEVYCRQDMMSDRQGIKILLSNSPDFKDYKILGEQRQNENIGQKAVFVKSKTDILDSYRYVRVYEGINTFSALAEVKIFVNNDCKNMYDVAVGSIPTANINNDVSYRVSDNDAVSFWKGNNITVKLDRCYGAKAVKITASGDVKITYGCSKGVTSAVTESFSDKETKNIFVDSNVSYVKLESTTSDEITVYDLKIYADIKNARIGKIEPEQVEVISQYVKIIDLGREVIIDHIEPCNLSVEVATKEDFADVSIISGCGPANVTARYIGVSSSADISVVGYESPKFVNSPSGKSVEFVSELYGGDNNTVIAATYEDDNTFKSVVSGKVSDGALQISDANKADVMIWDSIDGMKPVLPKAETEYVNKVPQAEFYVDVNVDSSGDGSESAPFKTIKEAQNAVREINDSMTGDIIVNLRGGRYYLDETLEFTEVDGGNNGYDVIYKNADGETPVISGGKKITGFTCGSNGVWSAGVDGLDGIYELMVNGEAATLARTEEPIKAVEFYNKGTSFNYDGIAFSVDKLPLISSAEEAYVHTTRSWMDLLLRVTAATKANGKVKLDIAQPYFDVVNTEDALSGHGLTPDADFYIENAYELLDTPGEFYYHKKKKRLYYMPRNGEDMTTADVDAAVHETILAISGADKSNHIENFAIQGIRFECSTLDKMYKYGHRTAQAQVIVFDTGVFLDGAIKVDYATNIKISDCVITGLTKPAISLGQGVTDSEISGNRIYNVGDGAIVIGNQHHNYISGREELCKRVVVSDNVISKVGQKHKGAPAIACYYVEDVQVLNNHITECNYTGISMGWGWDDYPDSVTCRRNRIAYNYIENYNLVATDGGAIYLLGQQPGTVIENNYMVQHKAPMQRTGICGIYPDEGSAYMTIRNNVIDMAEISNYGGAVRDINMWTHTVKDNFAHSNYVTYTNVRNDGTNCIVDTPVVFENAVKPTVVEKIIAASAINLD